jgi:hypothetical protein
MMNIFAVMMSFLGLMYVNLLTLYVIRLIINNYKIKNETKGYVLKTNLFFLMKRLLK